MDWGNKGLDKIDDNNNRLGCMLRFPNETTAA